MPFSNPRTKGFDGHQAGHLAAAMATESVGDDQQYFVAIFISEIAIGVLIDASNAADICRAGDSQLAPGPAEARLLARFESGQSHPCSDRAAQGEGPEGD